MPSHFSLLGTHRLHLFVKLLHLPLVCSFFHFRLILVFLRVQVLVRRFFGILIFIFVFENAHVLETLLKNFSAQAFEGSNVIKAQSSHFLGDLLHLLDAWAEVTKSPFLSQDLVSMLHRYFRTWEV